MGDAVGPVRAHSHLADIPILLYNKPSIGTTGGLKLSIPEAMRESLQISLSRPHKARSNVVSQLGLSHARQPFRYSSNVYIESVPSFDASLSRRERVLRLQVTSDVAWTCHLRQNSKMQLRNLFSGSEVLCHSSLHWLSRLSPPSVDRLKTLTVQYLC